MLNAIWIILVLLSILCGAFTGRMDMVAQQSMKSAKAAVMLAIGLVGVMAFWLGMMRVVQDAGLLRVIARKLRPLMQRLFPDVPPDHPAMSAMIMNISSNMLGLANAATPFGIKAMIELNKLNKHKGVATNAMALFLAMNTSNVALLPTGVIGVRTALGSNNPSGILFTTLFATICSTIVAIFAAKMLANSARYRVENFVPTTPEGVAIPDEDLESSEDEDSKDKQSDGTEEEIALPSESELGPEEVRPTPLWARIVQWCFWLTFLVAALFHVAQQWLYEHTAHVAMSMSGPTAMTISAHLPNISTFGLFRDILSYWVLPALIAMLALYGMAKGVKVYEALVTGAREGFDVAIRIIPFLVAILVAIGMFRASGGLDILVYLLSPVTTLIGMPAEALPMAILRPLSGSGAFGVMAEAINSNGPDSLVGYMVSTFQGSTETTFYVMAVYFGAVQVRTTRHTVIACLAADLTGIIAAVWICRALFG
ncbi:MAG TPA: spore maturation protein [Myxococcales bacterium]|nr:spore maturation protein [Deltaproteobacteria bacterium]MBU48089.1 spore maturation protein [Deltaproteobacteria bacterium]HAA57401.1 spore maturation protein [Myxococcales bacterium]